MEWILIGFGIFVVVCIIGQIFDPPTEKLMFEDKQKKQAIMDATGATLCDAQMCEICGYRCTDLIIPGKKHSHWGEHYNNCPRNPII